MITDWIVAQVTKLAPSPFSPDVERLVRKYAPSDPQRDHQVRELALVAAWALPTLPAASLWALVGWAVSSRGHQTSDATVRIGWAIIVAILVGLTLHLIRYYDALISKTRRREMKSVLRWPRVSTDFDLFVQVAIGVAVAFIGAPS